MAGGDSFWAAVDRQWSWVIVLGVSMSNMIMDGFVRGFGVFFAEFMLEFGGTASATALIYGLRNAIFVLLSPIAAGLGDRFSERAMIMAGGGILSLAYVLNYFAPNLVYVIIVLGVVNGLGSVPVVTCLPIVVGKHFQKRRSLATAFGYAGSAFGQLLIPHLVIYLVELYGVRGMMLIYGGIQLNNIAIGALFIPFEKLLRIWRIHGNRIHTEAYPLSKKITICVDEENEDPYIQDKFVTLEGHSANNCCNLQTGGIVLGDFEQNIAENYRNNKDDNREDDEKEKMLKEERSVDIGSTKVVDINLQHKVPCPDDKHCLSDNTENSISWFEDPDNKRPIGRCDKYVPCCDISLLLRPTFVVYFLATGLACAGFLCQVTFMVSRATEMGISLKQAAILLSISGGIDIAGRLSMGMLADVKSIGPIRVMIVYTMLIGVANTVYPSCESFPSMIGYAVVFGIFGSGGHILMAPTIVELRGTDKMASGVGWVIFAQGLGGAVFPPLMGLIRDQTGSYAGIFYACAAVQLLASALMVLVLYLHCSRHNVPFCCIKPLSSSRHKEHPDKRDMIS